jgi:hypothetical protein
VYASNDKLENGGDNQNLEDGIIEGFQEELTAGFGLAGFNFV